MSNVNQNEGKQEKCVLIGNKYFFNQGKYSINPKCIGLPFTLIFFIYNFIHISYYMNKLTDSTSSFLFLLILNIILFTLQILQSLNTTFTDPGSFLPNYGEDKSNTSEATLMIATIKGQDYFLKFCRTCLNAKDMRVYHCPDCGLCILRHDHHCPWLSTCIGLNNHKHFIILIIINLVFFIYNTIVLAVFVGSIVKNEKDENVYKLAAVDNIFLIFLLIINASLTLFHIALLINHLIYIFTGQTTSERVRRKKGATNPFTNDSFIKNFLEFWNYPMKYKERIQYNHNASLYLDTNILICDYLSGNYYLTPDKKVISDTYVAKGYNYNKGTIELMNKSIPSTEDGDNNTNIILDATEQKPNEN
jgi:palmitoyltransferase ZDHHC9/14/18